eukprot:8843943-Alexandrium_andersonii.AAC.1
MNSLGTGRASRQCGRGVLLALQSLSLIAAPPTGGARGRRLLFAAVGHSAAHARQGLGPGPGLDAPRSAAGPLRRPRAVGRGRCAGAPARLPPPQVAQGAGEV